MGLDMYLNARKYVQDWAHHYPDRVIPPSTPAKTVQQAVGFPFEVTYVEGQAGYWRKANHIHRWFVINVQDGEDECREHYASREKLAALLEVCKRVKADHSLAAELLPPQEGFFFGGTEFDEYYFADIDETIEILERAINCPDIDIDYYYHSSW